jgi:hypothetical protein
MRATAAFVTSLTAEVGDQRPVASRWMSLVPAASFLSAT